MPEPEPAAADETKESCEAKGGKWNEDGTCTMPEPEPAAEPAKFSTTTTITTAKLSREVVNLTANLKAQQNQIAAMQAELASSIWDNELAGYIFTPAIIADMKKLVKHQDYMKSGIFNKEQFRTAVKNKIKTYAENTVSVTPRGMQPGFSDLGDGDVSAERAKKLLAEARNGSGIA
jgi:hypothetical protein